VIVQVLPFAAGAHPAMDAPFTLLAFPGPGDPGIACPGAHPVTCLAGLADVQHYDHVFTRLQNMALSPQASCDLIACAAADLVKAGMGS
jgi:hypothetical protein